MRLGIDARVMQVGHQFRGIGEVFRQGCRQLDRRLPPEVAVTAFHDPVGPSVLPHLIPLFAPDREVGLVELPPNAGRADRLRDRLSHAQTEVLVANSDVFLQFDPDLGVPEGERSVAVVHDQIPILLGNRYPHIYLPTFRAARRAGLAPAVAAERATRRLLYVRNLTRVLQRADRIVSYSDHTASTTAAFAVDHGVAGVPGRTVVAPLGVDPVPDEPAPLRTLEAYELESLGLDRVPYLLYLGGVDDRRRIDLLVDSFNQLRAAGRDLRLVLAGDSFASVSSISVLRARRAIETSSYVDDIHLRGFVSPGERAWLYRHAAAVALPSEHEGFGLPVLESLAWGCPVVTFANSSLVEVAGPGCELVAPTAAGLTDGLARLLDRSPDDAERIAVDGRAWAARFTWDPFGEALADAVVGPTR